MYPTLYELEIGGELLSISSYRFFGFFGALLFLVFLARNLRNNRLNISAQIISVLWVAVSFLVGSRLLYSIFFIDKIIEDPSILYATRFVNFSMYGGLGLSVLSIWFVARWKKISLFKITDSLVPYTALTLILLRVGCFLNGCCFGRTTDVVWGVTFPAGSLAHRAQLISNPLSFFSSIKPVHPTQVYEIIGIALALVVAWRVWKKYKITGIPTATFIALYSTARFILHFFRHYSNNIHWLQSLQAPVLYASIAFLSLYFIIYLLKKGGLNI